jgi:membrane-bound ClpP family serine protease
MKLLYANAFLVAFYLFLIAEFFLPSGGLIAGAAAVVLIAALFLAFSHSMFAGWVMTLFVLITAPLVFYAMVKAWPHTAIGRRMLNRRPGEQAPPREPRTLPDGTLLDDLVGRTGIARSDLLPAGRIEIAGNKLDAISTGMPIDAGTEVIVTSVNGGRIHVRAITNADRAAADPPLPQSPPSLEHPLESFDIE